MFGQRIIARSIEATRIADQHGNQWQYHSRSDRHSKIACWVVLFDVLQRCSLLRRHVAEGKVAFGINHQMIDFRTDKRKDLDLVICEPLENEPDDLPGRWRSFEELAGEYRVLLDERERAILAALPRFEHRPVGDVLVALEAKAAMTAHVRAAPRLFDELTSAYTCMNGSSQHAVAVGLVMINASEDFVSSDRNKKGFDPAHPVLTTERQPNGAQVILDRVKKLRVRSHTTEHGYDAVGVYPIAMRNDGGGVSLPEIPGFPARGENWHYETMITRIASLYDGRFATR
ncbi:MAG: hypothetical protein MUD17_10685 [Gemmatimonadaceae bacterium]|jgi:hypothetical protein|nr:hypothetical protein [Gemmatimonadaceae bacterium]